MARTIGIGWLELRKPPIETVMPSRIQPAASCSLMMTSRRFGLCMVGRIPNTRALFESEPLLDAQCKRMTGVTWQLLTRERYARPACNRRAKPPAIRPFTDEMI